MEDENYQVEGSIQRVVSFKIYLPSLQVYGGQQYCSVAVLWRLGNVKDSSNLLLINF